MSRRAQTKLYRALPGRCALPNRAMQAAARGEARRRGTERFAKHRATASNREQLGAAARSEAQPRDSERQEAPLSQAGRANGFSSESEGQLWCGCVVAALVRAVQLSEHLCSLFSHLPLHALGTSGRAERLSLPIKAVPSRFGFSYQ
jgi:hypothetical protein